MANKKCLALTDEEYEKCIQLIRSGFELNGVHIKPNDRIATICIIQSCLGLRLGDILKLRMSSFVKDGNRYRLDIREQKTNKERVFSVPVEVYSFIQDYAIERGISKEAKLFDLSERQVQRHLNLVFKKMHLVGSHSSHSFRKRFATKAYEDSGYNIELVKTLLQHSSSQITARYLSITNQQIEEVLAKTVNNLI